MILVAAFLSLIGCGPDVPAACEVYVDAWVACIETAYAANQKDAAVLEASTEGTCQAYVGLEKDADVEALLYCYADVYTNADCSDPDGYVDATISKAACGT